MAIKYNPITGDFELVEDEAAPKSSKVSNKSVPRSKTATSLTAAQKSKLHSLSATLQRTYELAAEPTCNVSSIANARNLNESTIYDHLATLISEGLLNVHDYVGQIDYDEIKPVVSEIGHAGLKGVFEKLNCKYNYSTIKLVWADVCKTNRSATSRSTLSASTRIKSLKESEPMFDEQCKVAIAKSGYYLLLNRKYYKVGDLACKLSCIPGQIWRMKPKTSGYAYNIVHALGAIRYSIGEIKRVPGFIKFKPAQGAIISIPI